MMNIMDKLHGTQHPIIRNNWKYIFFVISAWGGVCEVNVCIDIMHLGFSWDIHLQNCLQNCL